VGHALGSARFAAQSLGWRMLLLDGTADDTVAALLGVDRTEDFTGAEREHPDCLAVVWPADQEHGSNAASIRCRCAWQLTRFPIRRDTPGTAKPTDSVGTNRCQWQILNQVAVAAWKSSTESSVDR